MADMIQRMGTVVNLLDRPTYSHKQVDRLLGLTFGTAQRWIDGYSRAGTEYPPVIREASTGDPSATWGEFVEARLLSEYRGLGIPMLRLRPAIDALREQLGSRYPLASARLWLSPEGRDLASKVQDDVNLEPRLALVVVRTNQQLLDPETRLQWRTEKSVLQWSKAAEKFERSVHWELSDDGEPTPVRVVPQWDNENVVIDPLRSFGEPVVRSVPTEVIAELIRAGDPPAMIANLYDLPEPMVDAAVRYELSRTPA